MEIFSGSEDFHPNREFFYITPSSDVYFRSNNNSIIVIDVPSYSIERRYGKLASTIYTNLVKNKCISKLSSSQINYNFLQLLFNSYFRLKNSAKKIHKNKPIKDKLKKFLSALPDMNTIQKAINKLQNYDFEKNSRTSIKRIILRAALLKLILFIYENYYATFDFPFFNNYFDILNISNQLSITIPNELISKVNDELKLKTNFFSRSNYINITKYRNNYSLIQNTGRVYQLL